MSKFKTIKRFFFFCAVMGHMGIYAQNDFAEKMNNIKLSGDYYTADDRNESEGTAFSKCISKIIDQLPADYRSLYSKDEIAGMSERLVKIGMPVRVFVYLNKNKLSKQAIKKNITLKTDLKIDNPVENPKPTPTPISNPEPIPKPNMAKELQQLVDDIKARSDLRTTYHSFEAKKTLGIVSDYGAMKDINDTNGVYIVIYDAQTEKLSALITPVESGLRKNLLTGSFDSFSNYHGIKAFWFKIK